MLILTELEAFRGFLTFRNDPLGKELGVQGWFPSGLGFDICYGYIIAQQLISNQLLNINKSNYFLFSFFVNSNAFIWSKLGVKIVIKITIYFKNHNIISF